jgi:hypothetical protein
VTFDGRWEARFVVPSGVTVSATNSGGGPTTVTVPSGNYNQTTLITALVSALNTTRTPANWSGSLSTGPTGTGRVTINCTGTWSLAWTSTELRDLLGFTAGYTSVTAAQTSPKQAKGLWLPDCPLSLALHPRMAPRKSDRRSTEGPLGETFSLAGNVKYEHRDLTYKTVPLDRIREASATYGNASYETFLEDTQDGDGHPWFGPGSAVRIWDHTGAEVGSDKTVTAWYLHGVPHVAEIAMAQAGWTGMYTVRVPRLTAKV